MPKELPFVWGSAYYRAPTPEPQCWASDLARMKKLGFNTAKFLVQWRWAHRAADRYFYEDLDPLMDLAAEHGLQVTLGVAMDVAPLWLYHKYPDARQVTVSGTAVQQHATAARPIGGVPGPCYNHPGALGHRRDFLGQLLGHFQAHPALGSWDAWSEGAAPSAPAWALRSSLRPSALSSAMVCYCHHCRDKFIAWLRQRYDSRDRLNGVWGRCYEEWFEVEVPRSPEAIADFIDWREFQLDTVAAEARWRQEMIAQRDPAHAAPAAQRRVYEVCPGIPVEPGGSEARRPGKVERNAARQHLLHEVVPQLAIGAGGVLFSRFRPEVLGMESAEGGLLHLDGSDREITRAAEEFWTSLAGHLEGLMRCRPRPARIGIWQSRRNEIFHQAAHGELRAMAQGIEQYADALYWNSYPLQSISGEALEAGEVADVKLLLMPSCDCLTEAEARSLDAWVRSGGVLVNEVNLGGYNATAGRHSRTMPGCGLAESWGIRELDVHGVEGCAPIHLTDGPVAWGAQRMAVLGGGEIVVEGTHDGMPCLVSRQIGQGSVYYCGTNLGRGARSDAAGLWRLLQRALKRAGIEPAADTQQSGTVHAGVLEDDSGPQFALLVNRSPQAQSLCLRGLSGQWRGLFTGRQWPVDQPLEVEAGFVDLLTMVR